MDHIGKDRLDVLDQYLVYNWRMMNGHLLKVAKTRINLKFGVINLTEWHGIMFLHWSMCVPNILDSIGFIFQKYVMSY